MKNGFAEVVGAGARADGDRDVVLHEPEDPSEVKVSPQAGWRFTDPRDAAFQHHVGATNLVHLVNESKEGEATIQITDDWAHTCDKTNWEEHVCAPTLVVGGVDHALFLLGPDDVGAFLVTNFTASAGEDGLHDGWTAYKPCRHPDCRARNPLKWKEEMKIPAPDRVKGEIHASGKILIDPKRPEGGYLLEGSHELSYRAMFDLEECEERKCVGGDVTNVTWDVGRLSVTNTPYLGLDLTDEGKKTNAVGIAEARYDCRPKKTTASYTWKFNSTSHGEIAAQDDEKGTARLESARPAEPSDTYQGDTVICHATLTETIPPDGHKPCVASATATNAVTVVKVDVQIGDIAEEKEETEGAFVQFANADGVHLSDLGRAKMVPVTFTCEPLLPADEIVEITVEGGGELYEKLATGELVKVECGLDGMFTARASEIGKREFLLHGDVPGASNRIEITHPASGAVDVATYTVVKISFITPCDSPVTHPDDFGEGQNEFTLSDAAPGVLTIELRAEVRPEEIAERIKGDCRFSVGSIGNSVMAWASLNPGGAPIASEGDLVATVTFTGLPDRNSDFGKKVATLSFRGEEFCRNDYEVFFPKLAKNHPACSTCPECSNWFYYWREGDVCSIPEDAIWQKAEGDHADDRGWHDNGTIYLTDLAAKVNDDPKTLTASFSIPTVSEFAIVKKQARWPEVTEKSKGLKGYAYSFERDITTPDPEEHSIDGIGGDGKGIGCAAQTAVHELCHKAYKQAWNEMVRQWEAKQRSIDEMRKEFGWDSVECASAEFDCALYEWFYDDEDLDRVLGGEERTGENSKILSDVKDPDTYNFARYFKAGTYELNGDQEIRARAAESNAMYHIELDWANPGCQYSKEPYGPKK